MKLTEFIQQQKRILFCPINKCEFYWIPDITKKQEVKDNFVFLYHCETKENGEDLFEENKMGLAGLKIRKKLILSSPFESNLYFFENEIKLIFVKSSTKELADYLRINQKKFDQIKFEMVDLPV